MAYCGCRNALERESNLRGCNSLRKVLSTVLAASQSSSTHTVCTHTMCVGTSEQQQRLQSSFRLRTAERIPKNKKWVWDYYRMACLYSQCTTARTASERIHKLHDAQRLSHGPLQYADCRRLKRENTHLAQTEYMVSFNRGLTRAWDPLLGSMIRWWSTTIAHRSSQCHGTDARKSG